MFIFHIDLTLTVAMVTENGCKNMLKIEKCHFGPNLISAQLNTKKINIILCILLLFIIHLNIFLVFACALS